MQRRWVGKNINLSQLSRWAEDFFKEKGFITEKSESKGEHTILWAPPSVKNMDKAMKVRIFGDPDDFAVEFFASETTRRSIWLGLLTKPFGGGYLMLKGLRLKEVLEAIEKDFWGFLEDKIASVAGSVGLRS